MRNQADLACLACPPKYRDMQTFYKYYKGEKTAPVSLSVWAFPLFGMA